MGLWTKNSWYFWWGLLFNEDCLRHWMNAKNYWMQIQIGEKISKFFTRNLLINGARIWIRMWNLSYEFESEFWIRILVLNLNLSFEFETEFSSLNILRLSMNIDENTESEDMKDLAITANLRYLFFLLNWIGLWRFDLRCYTKCI